MPEAKFQDTVINEMGKIKKVVIDMKREIDFIKDRFQDKILSDDDKKAIDETLKAEKTGNLKSMDEVFG